MIKILIYLLENYGLDALQLGIICFFGWKLLTNHFKHLQEDITCIKDSNAKTSEAINTLCQRVSTIEGKISK